MSAVAAPRTAPLFSLGTLCATPGALSALEENGQQPDEFVRRHVFGDWSEMCEEDQTTNAEAITSRVRVFSSYALKDSQKIWVITEADRSVTTLLLPSEY